MALPKPKGLGRGLDALLGGARAAATAPAQDTTAELAVGLLRPGRYQPRTRMDSAALNELADSIKARGVIQPVLVRKVDGNAYEILAGERRWRAAQIAGLQKIPVLVREVEDDAALAIGLIENIQREDLNPLEEAAGIKRLIDEFKLTHEEAAKAVARSRSAVSNLLRLLELAQPVQQRLLEGEIDMGHARALLSASKSLQIDLAARIAAQGLSVRETERLVNAKVAAPKTKRSAPAVDRDTKRLAEELSETIGATVTIKAGKGGKGSLIIDYASLDQLDGIIARIKR